MGTNAGEVYIQTGTSGNDTAIKVNSGGSVDLYFNGGSPKLSTTNTGATVTGTLTATSFVGALPISNDTNNRVLTATGSGVINGETNLTFDHNQLFINCGNYSYPLVVNSTQSSVRAVIRQTNDGNANSGLAIQKKHSTLHPANHWYGDISFEGWDGSGYHKGGLIECVASGTPANDNMPGELRFSTNSGGTGTTKILTITKDGHLYHTGGGNGRRYSFAGDGSSHYMKHDTTLNGIILNGYGGITFETNGTNERLRITSTGKVTIGNESSPGGLLHIKEGDSGLSAAGAHQDTVFIENSANAGITIATPNTNTGYLTFADPEDDNVGMIIYRHGGSNANSMGFFVNAAQRLCIDSSGRVLVGDINAVTPSRHLDVRGTGNQGILVGSTDNNGAQLLLDGIGGGDGSGGNYGALEVPTSGHLTIRNHDADKNIILGTGAANGSNDTVVITDGQKVGITQSSPQAVLHIGNYETTQNIDQDSVTQYFIDSTKSLKIARCNTGSITSTAAWYDVAVLAMAGFSYRCQVSIGGNFTMDVVEINVQTAYSSALGNKYSLQVSAKSASAHSNDRITQVRVAVKSNVHYLQVYIATGVDSNTNGKSVLETTCGIYAQNGADNAYPMFAAASGSYTNICHTFPDFGVHAAWDFTSNSSGVRSYTAWTGGGQNYITAEAAGNGSSHGNVGRFTAPMRGLYQVNFMVKSINAAIDNDCLISLYGSMTYNAQNPWGVNSEVYDPRGAATGAQGQQGEGNSWIMRMAAGDYFSCDYYRPSPTGYINGGGQIFTVSVFKVNS